MVTYPVVNVQKTTQKTFFFFSSLARRKIGQNHLFVCERGGRANASKIHHIKIGKLTRIGDGCFWIIVQKIVDGAIAYQKQ